MRVLIVTSHLNFGGISSYSVFLARKLKEKGHEVFVASSGGDMTKELSKYKIEHFEIALNTKSELNPKIIFSSFKITSFIRKNKINIMHAQTRVAQVSCFLASLFTRVPYITTCHGFFKPKFTRKLFKFWGSKVIAISEAVRAHLVNDLKVSKNKITMIHNGVDIANFKRNYNNEEKSDIRKEFRLLNAPVVGIIARLSSVKGHEYLIRAAKLILEKQDNVQFLIIGDGPEENKLKNLTAELKISNNVIFHKSILDTAKPLAVMDVFVMPSLSEGLGLAILEAMASSLPIVASNVGGIYSLISEGENGYLVPPKNPEALEKAILNIISDKRLAQNMGRISQKICEESFSLGIFAKQVEEVYCQVLTDNEHKVTKANSKKNIANDRKS
jgi:glycosyltransferase involved in cell wall biosynthesis